VRLLHLVGESLPGGSPVTVGSVGGLVPLDPRHGVFPNLVMTPLLSLLWAAHQEGKDQTALWEQVNELLEDNAARRFNAFRKHADYPANPEFELLSEVEDRLARMKTTEQVWALFGYQTVFGLIRWLLKGERKMRKQKIKQFAAEFLTSAAEKWTPATGLPRGSLTKMSAQEGYIHRLCTDNDSDGSGVVTMLRHAIERNTGFPAKVEEHLGLLRSFVPLLHNEAYQLTPYGIGQANFVLAADYNPKGTAHAGELYWRVMGKSLLRRLLTTTVPTP